MAQYSLYAVFLGFVSGTFMRSVVSFSVPYILAILMVSFSLALLYRRKGNVASSTYLLCVALFLLFFALGSLRMELATWQEGSLAWEELLGSKVAVTGTIAREPEYREHTTHLYVQSAEELFLVTTGVHHTASYGDVVLVEGDLQKPEAFETTLGRVFNYEGYMHARGVSYMIPFARVTVQDSGAGNPLYTVLFAFKHAFMRNIEKAIPSPHAGLSHGLLLGVKQALGETYEEAFVRTGITHIVVLSGYNIMLVTLFVMFVFSLCLPLRMRLLFGLLAVGLFAILVGLSATVVRASIMAGLMLVAQLTGRTYDVVRGLLVAGAAMLLVNPYLLVYDVGFQLSFTATLGLILLSAHLESVFRFMPKLFKLRDFLVATIAAQVFVMPILLYQIGEFSVVAVLVNVLVLPMVPVAMLLSFFAGILGFVSLPLSQAVGFAAYLTLEYILKIALLFAALPFASFTVPAFPFAVVVLVYAVLGLYVWRLYARTQTSVKTQTLHGWTIVEEEQFVKSLGTEKTLVSTTPHFFK